MIVNTLLKQLRIFLNKCNIQQPSQSTDFNQTEQLFGDCRQKAERCTNKQQMNAAAVKAWQSYG